MMQGVLTNNRVRLLFSKGMKTYRPRRKGERKRKSVRGCITSSDLAVMQLVMTKKGEQEIPGLTDDNKPRRLGPKPLRTSARCSTSRRRTTSASTLSAARQ